MILFGVLTISLLFGLGIIFASVDRQDVMANWDKKRCDIPVIIGSPLYKPDSYKKTALEFSTENFQFCMDKVVKEVFTVAINPFLTLFQQQIDAANVIKEIQNGIQEMLGNFFRGFSKILDGVFQRFIMVGFQFRRVFGEAMQAMNRIYGIVVSTLFMGMTMIVGIDNLQKFIAKVVMIIMGILAGLLIVLFFVLFPFLPLILTTVAVLVSMSVAGAGGLASTFCFAPSTLIETHRGSIRIDSIRIGDSLSNGAIVEGVLLVNGSTTQLYKLGEVIVSGDHLVFYEPLQRWVLVKEHPNAVIQSKQEPLLVCLNTSTRTIPIGEHLYRDWEELTPDLQEEWNALIASMLGSLSVTKADEYPLLSGAWFVETPEGRVNLRDTYIGMKIKDSSSTYTKILGIYEGEGVPLTVERFWHTDSIWWNDATSWMQKAETPSTTFKRKGFHLVTDSGTFMIFDETQGYGVRDFTEVGSDRIAETYEWMKRRL